MGYLDPMSQELFPEENPTRLAVAFGVLIVALVVSILYVAISAAVLRNYVEASGPQPTPEIFWISK